MTQGLEAEDRRTQAQPRHPPISPSSSLLVVSWGFLYLISGCIYFFVFVLFPSFSARPPHPYVCKEQVGGGEWGWGWGAF